MLEDQNKGREEVRRANRRRLLCSQACYPLQDSSGVYCRRHPSHPSLLVVPRIHDSFEDGIDSLGVRDIVLPGDVYHHRCQDTAGVDGHYSVSALEDLFAIVETNFHSYAAFLTTFLAAANGNQGHERGINS